MTLRTAAAAVRDCTHAKRYEHGTLHGYINDRCRCQPCRDAHAQNARLRRRMIAYRRHVPKSIPNFGSKRRIEALACNGWSMSALSVRLGWSPDRLRRIFHEGDRISPRNAELISALFDELWDVPAPRDTRQRSCSVGRTLALARRRGYMPALAWDDIDNDPAPATYHRRQRVAVDEVAVELACSGEPVPLNSLERREAVRRLNAQGLNDTEIARRLHRTPDAVLKTRERHLPRSA